MPKSWLKFRIDTLSKTLSGKNLNLEGVLCQMKLAKGKLIPKEKFVEIKFARKSDIVQYFSKGQRFMLSLKASSHENVHALEYIFNEVPQPGVG